MKSTMQHAQQWLAHRLWELARWIEQRANNLFHHPFTFQRFTCWQCEKPAATLRVRELNYGPHGYKPVCRKCYDETPF
jgi:RNase P subunit RPR2